MTKPEVPNFDVIDIVVDEFYRGLTRLCNDLGVSARNYGYEEYVQRVLKDLEGYHRDGLHNQMGSADLSIYRELAKRVLSMAQILVESHASAGGVRLALEWIATGPRRLLDLLVEEENVSSEWDGIHIDEVEASSMWVFVFRKVWWGIYGKEGIVC